jgi:hypothetical protein
VKPLVERVRARLGAAPPDDLEAETAAVVRTPEDVERGRKLAAPQKGRVA